MIRRLVFFLRARLSVCTVALLAALALLPATLPVAGVAAERIVAVGDVHGDWDSLVAILQRADLIDSRHRWTGGKATLVQTGDFLDRGANVREVMDLLMALEKRAPKAGGQVVVLLGNHEVMNLYGDLRYVTAETYARFGDKNSEKRRQAAYRNYAQLLTARAEALQQTPTVLSPQKEQEWKQARPLGFIEHREAFSPEGKYGRWLRERPALVRLGDTIFLHGGISPQLGPGTLEQINDRIRQEIRAFDAYRKYLVEKNLILPFSTLEEMTRAAMMEVEARRARPTEQDTREGQGATPVEKENEHVRLLENFLRHPEWLSVHSEGPLWYRGFAETREEEGAASVASLLRTHGAAHFVVGHTFQRSGRIQARLSGRVFLIDTGMLTRYYPGGRAAALEIQDGKFTAIYLDERVVLHGAVAPATNLEPGDGLRQESSPAGRPDAASRVWLGPNGQPLPFTSDEQVLEFLRTARVLSIKEIGEGITHPRKVLLEKDGIRAHAIFREINEEKIMARMRGGQTEMMFRDSFIFECAAYELSRLLGLDNVPPVVERRIGGASGSLQMWVEKAMTETVRTKRNLTPPDPTRWRRQVGMMWVFDNLVYNTDRNLGNILIDANWNLWMIDHTRAFRRREELRNPGGVVECERNFWEKLQMLDADLVRQRLKKYLRPSEIEALCKRRAKLVEHIQKLIGEKGQAHVLFTYE